jgi:DNA-binding NtrC family response regulator
MGGTWSPRGLARPRLAACERRATPEASGGHTAGAKRGVFMGGKIRILIVDDNEHLAENLREIFAYEGMEASACGNAKDAIARLDAGEPCDLVITDYRMPGLDGIQLATWIRERRPRLPVLLFSGYLDGLTPDMARRTGLEDVLRKPQDLTHLVLRANELSAKSGEVAE